MALTPSLIGRNQASNAASLSITTAGNLAAGHKIYLLAAFDQDINGPHDSAGNNYLVRAGSASEVGLHVFLWAVDSSLQLPNASTITIEPAFVATFDASMAAFSATGLISGQITGSSSAFGRSTTPFVTLPNVPTGDYALGVVGVLGPSADGFTQDPTFTNPGTLNTQTTTALSCYAGYRLVATGGVIQYLPTLGVVRDWIALLIQFSP